MYVCTHVESCIQALFHCSVCNYILCYDPWFLTHMLSFWKHAPPGPGASNDPCSGSYHGPSADSEIEVKNVVKLIKGHGNFKSLVSVHTYSQLLMYPYGYSCRNVPHQPELVRMKKLCESRHFILIQIYGRIFRKTKDSAVFFFFFYLIWTTSFNNFND